MRHCKSCVHCVIDLRALDMGVFVEMCSLDRHLIPRPFLCRLGCKNYKKCRRTEKLLFK